MVFQLLYTNGHGREQHLLKRNQFISLEQMEEDL